MSRTAPMRLGKLLKNQMCATGVANSMWPEPLAADFRLDNLHAALFANDTSVLHALVLTAIALVVLDWPEDLRTEQAHPVQA